MSSSQDFFPCGIPTHPKSTQPSPVQPNHREGPVQPKKTILGMQGRLLFPTECSKGRERFAGGRSSPVTPPVGVGGWERAFIKGKSVIAWKLGPKAAWPKKF